MSERLRIWSNGTEFESWEYNNCGRCWKAPTAKWGGACDLNDAIALAYIGDGTFSPEIVTRLGYTDGNPLFRCRELETAKPSEQALAIREMTKAGAEMLPGFGPSAHSSGAPSKRVESTASR